MCVHIPVQLPVKSPSNIQLVDVNVNREIEQSSVIPHLSLSEEDIDKIATDFLDDCIRIFVGPTFTNARYSYQAPSSILLE
jgi:hypothetical protein